MADSIHVNDRITLPAECLEVRTSRSGGPGGQHANTADTRVQLWFDLDRCDVLHRSVKRRLRQQQVGWLTTDGRLLVVSDAHRSQHRNLDEVRQRLADAVRLALKPPKRRKKTRPTRASKRRRLKAKKRRGELKKKRGRVRRPRDD